MKLGVRIIPNAKQSAVVGQEGRTWVIRLAAPPIDGKANESLIRFLSQLFDCAPSEIDIVKGFSSKQKILDVPNDAEDVLRKASL